MTRGCNLLLVGAGKRGDVAKGKVKRRDSVG